MVEEEVDGCTSTTESGPKGLDWSLGGKPTPMVRMTRTTEKECTEAEYHTKRWAEERREIQESRRRLRSNDEVR
jgi:hypothetical protein